jgi:hypothetical protein
MQEFVAPSNRIPISQGFLVTKNKSWRGAAIRLALEELDKVIADGVLLAIPLRFGTPKTDMDEKLEGLTVFKKSVLEVVIHQNTLLPAMTTLHEIGHRLEIDALNFGTSQLNPLSLFYQALIPWRAAMRKSLTVQALNNYKKAQKDDFAYAAELLKPSELFARSFAQYIVVRSRNKTLYAELETIRNCENLGFRVRSLVQWSDQEFDSIATAFDQLFMRLGWLK